MIYLGVPIGYATKQTLLDDSVRECLGDLKALQPTIMTGVPLVWEGIRKGIMAKVPEEKLEAFTTMINLRYNASKINMEWLLKPATNFLAFNKAKAFTGGKLRFALSGGAPINPETQKFISIVICPVIQGLI